MGRAHEEECRTWEGEPGGEWVEHINTAAHAPRQTALFILIHLIFRSKLIPAFNNRCRTAESERVCMWLNLQGQPCTEEWSPRLPWFPRSQDHLHDIRIPSATPASGYTCSR